MGKLITGRWPLFLTFVLLTFLLTACPPRNAGGSTVQRRDAKPNATTEAQGDAENQAAGRGDKTPAQEATPTPTAFYTPTPGPTATATPSPRTTPDTAEATQLTDEAHQLFLKSDLTGAEAKAVEAIAADPSYLPAHLQLTDVYLYLPQDWQQALRSAEAATKLAPDDPLALAYLAWAQQGAHHFDEARTNSEHAVELAPDNAVAQQALADVLSSVYEMDAAYEAAQKAVDLAPESASAWVSLGTIASTLEYPDKAWTAYEKAVDLEPDFFTWHILLARHELEQTGDVDAALELAQPAIDLQPDHPFVLSFLVDIAIEKNDWESGEADCAKLFAYNGPDTPYPDAYSCMAGVKLFQEDNAGADYFQTLAEAIAPPERFDITVMRMRLLNDKDECEQSRQLAEAWLKERSYSVLALRMIGVGYLCAEEYDKAADYFSQALEKLPRSIADARLLANAYARDDKPTEALAALNRVRSFASENPLYYQALYEMHLFLGQTKDAIRAAQRWQVLRPDSTEAMTSLALAELFDNNPAAALSQAQNALDAGATSSTVYTIMGESYSRAGDADKAEQYLLQALAINPEHFLAHSFIAQLYLVSGRCDDAEPHVKWLVKELVDNQETADSYEKYLQLCREQAAAAAATPDPATALDDEKVVSEVTVTLRKAGVTSRTVEFAEDNSQRSLLVVYDADLAKDSSTFLELERSLAIELAKLLPRITSRPDGLLIVSGAQDEPQHILFIATRAAVRWVNGELSDDEFEKTWLQQDAGDLPKDNTQTHKVTSVADQRTG
jgi:tetratricopeptide (TPR) repeat protein